MRQEIEQIQLIDKYLRGELSGTHLDTFKNKLRNDAAFAAEVYSQSAIIEGIKLARKEQLLALLNGGKIPTPSIENKIPIELPFEPEERLSEVFIPINHPIEEETEEKKEETSNYYSTNYESKIDLVENTIPKTKSNFNNWYFAAAAVLLALFIYYYIFGYYIPHQRLVIANADSIASLENTSESSAIKEDEAPKPLVTNMASDSLSTDSIILSKSPREIRDSLLHSDDKKLSKTQVSVSSFETNTSTSQNSDQNSNSEGKSRAFIQLNNNTLDVENWHTSTNFKGYKLRGSTLKIFDLAPEESLNLKYLDKKLFIKKGGKYYKLRNSGYFESFQEETNSDLIKLLDTL